MKNKFITEKATNISKKLAIREYTNTEDHNNMEKLEKVRVQIEFLQKQSFSSDIHINHIIGIMWAVYFLAKKNLSISILSFIIKLIRESDLSNLSDSTITYVNHISENEFLKVISNTIEEEIWNELFDTIAFGMIIDKSTDITTTKHLDIYVSYITKEGILKTHFLCLIHLTSFNAEGITKVLVSIFEKKIFI